MKIKLFNHSCGYFFYIRIILNMKLIKQNIKKLDRIKTQIAISVIIQNWDARYQLRFYHCNKSTGI